MLKDSIFREKKSRVCTIRGGGGGRPKPGSPPGGEYVEPDWGVLLPQLVGNTYEGQDWRAFTAMPQPLFDAFINRQSAVRDLSKVVDVILVVGAANSSNSNRLCEIGKEEGLPSYLIADASSIDPAWLEGKEAVGVTAGASAPEELVREVVDAFAARYAVTEILVETAQERIEFKVPRVLRESAA